MASLLDQIERRPGASDEALKAMVARIGVEPPDDYLKFLRQSNGGTGSGPDIFVNLFAAEEVGTSELDYGASEYALGLIVIGGDGLGNILGIDTRKSDRPLHEYVVLDPVWMDLDSESVQYRGKTLSDMLEHVSRDETDE
jgi:SMI1 / KNR4 family (SUKH-1)